MPPRFPDGVESRTAAVELRVSAGRVLEGYGAVFGVPALIGGRFTESLRAGCFAAHLSGGADVFLLAHHDFAQPLARTGNGSLRLHEDAKGLAFSTSPLPATRAADDILELARSGTIAGCSFSFRVPEGGDTWPARDRRELIRLELIEVSAVAAPAYPDATISARALARCGVEPVSLRRWRTWLEGARR